MRIRSFTVKFSDIHRRQSHHKPGAALCWVLCRYAPFETCNEPLHLPEADTRSPGFGGLEGLKEFVRQQMLRNPRTVVRDLDDRLPLIAIFGNLYPD